MSTRCTIGYDKDFHLYEECFDTNNVYLELDGDKHSVELEYSSHVKNVVISIDVTTWRKIVDSWINSNWGKNASQDHKEHEIDTEYINKLTDISLRAKAKKEISGRKIDGN
jgi:hypothetical protein